MVKKSSPIPHSSSKTYYDDMVDWAANVLDTDSKESPNYVSNIDLINKSINEMQREMLKYQHTLSYPPVKVSPYSLDSLDDWPPPDSVKKKRKKHTNKKLLNRLRSLL